ncbi:hypothetical protein FRACYDRAFT_251852 [Fragilariopsis cylindrus CCMP1102]|uniref:Prolyl 4-hydroxylase alpha subunit domain-containing protein n=1 Tax=Fragilariopsis cylindrus CCMP1102 TaxID=635003 RepID=A0A1E7EME8_9STRA|nr:hypothetical protein FRACYDRAFT_251852 [Fragilariopsis cylindrus CCMP1102]|eukprot:OEU07112.1 hypothetical protein FRACYDRAFT_251852 [Fragilariopsis cylindrus CCMP1102]
MICVNNNDDLTHDDTAASISSSSCSSSDAALCDILGLSGLSSVIGGGGGGIIMTMAEEDVVELEEEEIPMENGFDALTSSSPTVISSDISSSSSSSNTLPHRHPVLPIRRPQARRIKLPNSKGVSRKYYNPEDCFAFEITNILTKEECLQLINVAANSSSSSSNNSSNSNTNSLTSSSSTNSISSDNKDSFQYITHAMHTSPDGETKFEVKLERPNPHKLAVFHSKTIVEELLWKRLQPILLLSSSLDGDGEAVQQDDNNNDDNNEDNNNTTLSCLSNGMTQFIKRESISMPIGLNPRLRVLKYDAGDNDEFQPHFDATTEIALVKFLLEGIARWIPGRDFGALGMCSSHLKVLKGVVMQPRTWENGPSGGD